MIAEMTKSATDGRREAATLLQVREKGLVKRPQLIEKLLEDRGALRLIAAPHGFGKSTLAQEYAYRLFDEEEVIWIKADQPEFIQSLDEGYLVEPTEEQDQAPKLIVIDNLPYLDEERVQTLSGHIDLALYQGIEVMATSLPSHDCLSYVQPDRLLITANDLLVTRKEFEATQGDSCLRKPMRSKEECLREWERLRNVPFGLTPAYVWNDELLAQQEGLAGFFEEQLPLEIPCAVFCMLLLERGDFSDLASLDVDLRSESEQTLVRDYPFLGIDPLRRGFDVSGLSLDTVRAAVVVANKVELFTGGDFPLVEKVLVMLFDRGDSTRGREVLERFCAEESYTMWLMNRGWDLLDRGEVEILEALFEGCSEKTVHHNPELSALRAWACGLRGDLSDAMHFASWAYSVSQVVERSEGESNLAGMMAYLALLAFDCQDEVESPKGAYASSDIARPADLLASVVDTCSEVELARALRLALSEGGGRELYQEGTQGSGIDTLRELLNQGESRFRSTLPYRISLHLAASVDSIELRGLLKNLGRGAIMPLRRSGVKRFSEAILVADLWRCGMFGVSGRSVDARDACLLNDAAVMLRRLASLSGIEACNIPWESAVFSGAALPVSRVSQTGAPLSALMRQNDRLPTANVRLFGCAEIVIGDEHISESCWRRKPLQLFAMLVMHQGREVSREFILGQLWPKASHQHGLDSYYAAWSGIAKTLGDGRYLQRRGDFCRVNSHGVSSDVGEFEQLTRRVLTKREDATAMLDISTRLEALYRGGLMPGSDVCPFITAQRDRYHGMFIDSMVSASLKALEIKDERMALWFANKAMEHETHREDVYNTLMHAQVAAGQRCSAIRTYFKCCDFLREELGLDPSEKVQSMYSMLIENDPTLLRLAPSSER